MPKMVLRSYKAEPSPGSIGGVALILDFQDPPIPREIVEVNNTSEAMAALETYKAKAIATGEVLAVSIDVAKGDRSPPGFKAARQSFYGVNVPA